MLIWIVVLAIIIVIASAFWKIHRANMYMYSKELTAPPWADETVKELIGRFNDAWSNEAELKVSNRIRKSEGMRLSELTESWYELKKYLFLAGISKGLPMFSTKVDDIWHELLEEPEYEPFCIEFIGELIQHRPHGEMKHLPDERAWFDILYLSFFSISSKSSLWGDFLNERGAHQRWINRLKNETNQLHHEFSRKQADKMSTKTLLAFLQWAIEDENDLLGRELKVRREDGYYFGSVIVATSFYMDIETEQVKAKEKDTSDSGGGYYSFSKDSERQSEWSETVSDVNSYQTGTDSGNTSTHSSGGHNYNGGGDDGHTGGSDSGGGSSCSSCSGCSS